MATLVSTVQVDNFELRKLLTEVRAERDALRVELAAANKRVAELEEALGEISNLPSARQDECCMLATRALAQTA